MDQITDICYVNNKEVKIKTWEISLMHNKCQLTINLKDDEKTKLNDNSDNIIFLGNFKELIFISKKIKNNEERIGTNGDVGHTIKFEGEIANKSFNILNKPYIEYSFNYKILINNNKVIKFDTFEFNKDNKKNRLFIILNKEIISQLSNEDQFSLYYNNTEVFNCTIEKIYASDGIVIIKNLKFNINYNYDSKENFNNIIMDDITLKKGVIDWGYANNNLQLNFYLGQKNINLLFRNIYNSNMQIQKITIFSDNNVNYKKYFMCSCIKTNMFYVKDNKLMWHLSLDVKEEFN